MLVFAQTTPSVGAAPFTFGDYIASLREQLTALVAYQGHTTGVDPRVLHVQAGLNHADPFIVFEASLAATELMRNKNLFH